MRLANDLRSWSWFDETILAWMGSWVRSSSEQGKHEPQSSRTGAGECGPWEMWVITVHNGKTIGRRGEIASSWSPLSVCFSR